MTTLVTPDSPIDLREVTVRPTRGAREHRLWDRLVKEHHYLRFHGIIGKGLRHVALHGETWVALVGWQPGSFKLAARDRWIGWTAEQQFRRLHLIANNSRFVILGPRGVPNLASRVLGLSLRRLSADIEAAHGYPVSENPMHVRTPSVGTLGGLRTIPPVVAGPCRERRKPKPMMDGLKKSDGAVGCAGQRPDQVGSSPTGARVRGAISKSGGHSSLAGVSE